MTDLNIFVAWLNIFLAVVLAGFAGRHFKRKNNTRGWIDLFISASNAAAAANVFIKL